MKNACLKPVLLLLYAVSFFFSHLLADNYTYEKSLQLLVEQSSGSLIDFSPEIRAQAIKNPVKQKVSLDLPDLIFEQICFIDGNGFYNKKSTIDLSTCTFSTNPELCTLTLSDDQSCTMKFASLKAMEDAAALLSELQGQIEKGSKKTKKFSQIARDCGYSYLAVSPRGFDLIDIIENLDKLSDLRGSSLSVAWAWLTKSSSGHAPTLLKEGGNRLPIFLFPLEDLDSSIFYVTNQLNGQDSPFSHAKNKIIQSASSKNPAALLEFMRTSKKCTIVFQSGPKLSTCSHSFLLPQSIKKLSRIPSDLRDRFIDPNLSETEPLYNAERPTGSTITWVTGASPYSYNALSYALHKYSSKRLLDFLQTEYPKLMHLLHQSSRSTPHTTLLKQAVANDEKPNSTCSTQEEIFNRLAGFGFELGGPFGPDNELKMNTYPLFLSLLEQTALHKTYGPIIEWYYFNTLPENRIQLLFHIDRLSYITFLPRDQVWRALYRLQKLFKLDTKPLDDIRNIVPSAELYLSGKPATDPHDPQRQLYSSYFWETIDPLHRDGISMMRKRNAYEAEILENPNSRWFGKFFEWLEKQKYNKTKTIYLSKEERKAYIGKFDGNRIIYPRLNLPSKSIIFVIDHEGNIYFGTKIDGEGDVPSFAHSSFLSGGPVASAGKLSVGPDGTILKMSRLTGHYRSGDAEMAIAFRTFTAYGVDMDQISH